MARGHSPGTTSGFVRRFAGLAGGYWSGPDRWSVWPLAAALLALTVAQVSVPVMMNLWSQRLFDALEQRAMDRLPMMAAAAGGILLYNIAVTVAHLWVKRRLQFGWRAWLTRRLVGDWVSDGREHALPSRPGNHDNPDGRIAEDVRVVTELAVDLGHSLTYCLLLLVSFAGILWRLSGVVPVAVGGVSVPVPGHLLLLALAFAAAGTTAALAVARPLVRAAERRQGLEADFRFGLARVRENASVIARQQGEAVERGRLALLFGGVRRGWDGQTGALVRVMAFGASYSVLSAVFPILVVAPRYAAGAITLGMMMQTAQAFQQAVAALSWPIDNLATVAQWTASVERVQGLREALDGIAPLPPVKAPASGFLSDGGNTARKR
ncbi:putative ATP-binding cassette transporter [Azospirillum brasilense]|uniref:Putative ATP-binding cassette transporter n=1 Tax=Azospirillum brasilense TaxID=192 RepID=A0A560BK06_AZOBR|nr:SbmA/BacA-like family transporter [Azospirillum brasilense]TWA72926.1 putative ATP-binding cassette transporter [Azospirillum brasilense]